MRKSRPTKKQVQAAVEAFAPELKPGKHMIAWHRATPLCADEVEKVLPGSKGRIVRLQEVHQDGKLQAVVTIA